MGTRSIFVIYLCFAAATCDPLFRINVVYGSDAIEILLRETLYKAAKENNVTSS